MNILTFDIEEWYVAQMRNGKNHKYDIYNHHLIFLLDLLEELEIKATFFCVGKMAVFFPEVINRISDAGHEIGCHSNEHRWVNKLTPDEFKTDTREAIQSLEDLCGKPITSYRAPAFSIDSQSTWAFEILVECGIEIDSSIFPAMRALGGFPSFPYNTPCIIETKGLKLKEYPIPTIPLLKKDLAYSGGGYFRVFPLWIIRKIIKKDPIYQMFYLHINDFIHHKGGIMTRREYEDYFMQNGTFRKRLSRYLKSNIFSKGTFCKLEKLLRGESFVSLSEATSRIDWSTTPLVSLSNIHELNKTEGI